MGEGEGRSASHLEGPKKVRPVELPAVPEQASGCQPAQTSSGGTPDWGRGECRG